MACGKSLFAGEGRHTPRTTERFLRRWHTLERHEQPQSLRTDVLDSVLIHDPIDMESVLAPGQALDTLLEMKSEGSIRHIGAGVRSHAFHKELIETGHIDIILTFLDYTLLSQSASETTLPLAREHDVGIILASPLGMGSLTGAEPNVEAGTSTEP